MNNVMGQMKSEEVVQYVMRAGKAENRRFMTQYVGVLCMQGLVYVMTLIAAKLM